MKKLFCRAVSLSMVISIVLTSGCASIVSKSQYPVNITSHPSDAGIVVRDESGKTYFNGKTPSTVILAAGNGYFKGKNYTVTFSKAGFNEYTTEIKRGVDGWYIGGNLLFGGLIGYLIVDPATGAMWTLPKEVTATLTPGSSHNGPTRSMHIVSVEDIPVSLRAKMVRIQ